MSQDEYVKWLEKRLARLECIAREMWLRHDEFAMKHERFNVEADRVWTELGVASGVLVLPFYPGRAL